LPPLSSTPAAVSSRTSHRAGTNRVSLGGPGNGPGYGLFATILVTLGRIKLAAIVGGIGIWIVARSM